MTKNEMNLGGAVPRYLAILVAAVLGLSLFPAAAFAQTAADGDVCPPPGETEEDAFSDDDGTTHEDNINCVVAYNIAQGFSDGTYRQGASISRGQMATFIANFLDTAGVNLPAGPPDAFADDNGNVHEGNINSIAALGVVQGFADGTYRPGRDVSRQQMATYIANAIEEDTGESMPAGDDAFTDDETSVHESNINKLAAAEVVQGVGGTLYNPLGDVTRGQMATFIINGANYLDAVGEWLPTAGADLALSSTTAEAGGAISGVVSGDVTGVSVNGCGLTNQTLSDSDAAAEGFQFSVTIPSSQPAGECELTFTITQADGETLTITRTITVTEGAAGTGVTSRPELLEAEVTEVDTTGTDAGTTIRYCFDEEVERVVDETDFHAYNGDGDQYTSTEADLDSADENCVLAFFPHLDLQAQAGADALTVATVNFDAVQDVDNEENPIGDAPLGDEGGDTTLPAGVTGAPDLIGVDVQNQIGATDTYETLFTFDETVDMVNDINGFHLILEDGVTQIDCVAQETDPGDATVDTECDLGDDDPPDVSRGVVDALAVEDAGGRENPTQAAEGEGDDGNTETPDLVSGRFFFNGDDPDEVAYTFDEPVDILGCDDFDLYDTAGDELGIVGTCTEDTARVILVEFPDGTLDAAVGAITFEGAVVEAGGLARPNLDDEVGVENSTTEQGAGATIGPDLIEVNVEEQTSSTGTVTGVVATYTFDEDVDTLLGLEFFLLEADGTRYQAEDCELTDAGDEPTVECDDWEELAPTPDADPDDEDVLEAVLGTVDDGQVDDGTNLNPEGAEPVTA